MVAGNFGNHPFFRQFWYDNYYRAYFSSTSLMILTARREGVLVAAIPMVRHRRWMAGIPIIEAQLLGGPHSHLNRLLVLQEDDQLAALMIERLLQEGIDLIYFEDLPESFPDQTWLEDFCQSNELALDIRKVRQSPFIPTVGDYEEYRRGLSKKFRQLLNNRLNRINREGGFNITVVDTEKDFAAIEPDIRLVSTDSWQGSEGSGIFSGDTNSTFYLNLLRHSLAEGYGQISVLYYEDQPAAFEYHIRHDGTEYCLKSEYSQKFDRVSPGAVLDMELVKRAFDSEVTTYDLLGFSDSYKLRWTDRLAPYYRYFIFNRSLAARAAYALYFRWGNRLRNLKSRIASF